MAHSTVEHSKDDKDSSASHEVGVSYDPKNLSDVASREPSVEIAGRRFAFTLSEFSGALGDLGTFLPHIIGAITVVGMDPTGIFMTFGLFYAFAGGFYGLPMAVQPMKAASAAVLIQPLDPAAVAGAGLVIGAFFLIVGATGVIERLARALPPTIAAGLQLGLGLSLAALGIRLVEKDIALGLGICLVMLILMRIPRMPGCACRCDRERGFRHSHGHLATISASRFRSASAASRLADMEAGDKRRRICRAAANSADVDQCNHRDGSRLAAIVRRRGAAC